jgi:RHS repeat-associated protein
MNPAAKHFDPVLGVDIHIVATPVGPVPIPHPFVGFLFDALEYVPISIPIPVPFVGVVEIPLNASIKINGVYRAIAGTMGRTVPGVHFPIGGSFIKPPANECEMFMGSATVEFDGDAASYRALPTLDCQCVGMPPIPRLNIKKRSRFKSLVLPTGIVLPITLGPPVLIGGSPTISLTALAFKAVFSLARFGLAKGLKKVKASKVAKRVSQRVHNAADSLLTKLGLSTASRIRNAIHRIICKRIGHPVDVATGKLFTELIDFELTGTLPLSWQRVWYSTSSYVGPLGHGWHHNWDLGLIAGQAAVAVRMPDGRTLAFPAIQPGQDALDEAEGVFLSRGATGQYALTDAEDRTYRFAFVGRGEEQSPVAVEDDGGGAVELRYDAYGRLAHILDANGSTGIHVGWDANRRITEICAAGNADPTSIEALVRYEYDALGNMTAAVDAAGNAFRYAYENHLLTAETDRLGYTFFFLWDGRDEHARCIHTYGADGLYDVQLTYQPDRTIAQFSDGGVWTYRHNGVSVTELVDPEGGVTQYHLDELGRVVEEVDPNGNVTQLEYDGNGRHTRRVGAGGQVEPPEQEEPDPPDPNEYELPGTAIEWEQGERITPGIDGAHDPAILSILPETIRAELQRLRAQAAPRQTPAEFLDELRRVVEKRYADGSSEFWTYDAAGNVISHRDRDGHLSRQQWGSWSLLLSEANGVGSTVQLEYSSAEELVRLVDAGGAEHRFAYDQKDRNTAIWINGQLLESYAYDVADNLVETRDSSGAPLVRYEPGPGSADARRILRGGEVHKFGYDDAGRMTLAQTPEFVCQFAYDGEGRLVRDLRDGLGVEHAFGEDGEIAATTLLSRFKVQYARDADFPDVLAITDPTGRRHSFAFGSEGEVLRVLANGTTALETYDPDGRKLTSYAWPTDSERRVFERRYRYSPGGDLVEVQDALRRATAKYEYDAAHRLQKETRANGETLRYRFDEADNLAEKPGFVGVVASANQLALANRDVLRYNDRRNVVSHTGPSRAIKYEYDALDRLTSITTNQERWDAAYDPLARRVSKTWRGATTRFWWDDFRLAAEERPDGTLRMYVYVDHKAMAPFLFVEYESAASKPETGRCYFVFTNQIGAPVRVEDDSGDVVWAAELEPFGAAHVTVNRGIDMPLRFPGHYFDSETGLHYNRFRYYSPELGRYLQFDPLGIEGDVNPYVYSTNPLVSVDIDGLAKYTKAKKKAKKAKTSKKKTSAKKKSNKTRSKSRQKSKKAAKATKKRSARKKPTRTAAPKKPPEPYSRKKYGRTPTASDRKALGARKDEVLDHDPPLVKRYYEGDPKIGEKPGTDMTDAELRASAKDRSRMHRQPRTESNRQGAEMSRYSRAMKKKLGIK